ncbi:MAG: stimulus-sensing domain-containing protein [Defluviicoccus sp.]|nr:stimulus-sensing domain-containing protein [Defluviicoccus sp.]MDG4592791.1 stimulus-sensing domain-containing protein [Defluviicoccus sp.]
MSAQTINGKPSARVRRRLISPITLRILAVNLLALAVLLFGMIYLEEYRRGLIAAELGTLENKAKLFAAAITESATSPDPTTTQGLIPPLAQQMVRRLVEASDVRAILFFDDGALLADSLLLIGPGGSVEVEALPPPKSKDTMRDLLEAYDRMVARLWQPAPAPAQPSGGKPSVADFPEIEQALAGSPGQAVRPTANGSMNLSVAVPVLRYKHVVGAQVLGALVLTKSSSEIDAAVLKVRLDILRWFAVALGVTVLLSLYLAGTIARPIRILAAAAERVRRDRHRKRKIPDFANRHDEIGQLASALSEMTDALWLRMDAIEQFAADVSHELKNPLTSLRSAVETVAHINDPKSRERLMEIILEDVARLDRLISDISDASRLDAELSRADAQPVDIGRMLETLANVAEASAGERQAAVQAEIEKRAPLVVNGIESRLVQVFQNLIANAVSFSPTGGTITLKAERVNGMVVAEVLDEGPGIPDGLEKQIFARFYSHRPNHEAFGLHSGLGLSISQQIVSAHGGTVRAENRQDRAGEQQGARFVVELPAQ